MRMWRNVAQAFENRKREIGSRQLMSETFADQPRQRIPDGLNAKELKMILRRNGAQISDFGTSRML